MKKMRLMLIAACLLSASMASAAITYETIDFDLALTGSNYAALDSVSNVTSDGGIGKWINAETNNTIQFNFDQAVRLTSIELKSSDLTLEPKMTITGISGATQTVLVLNQRVDENGTVFTLTSPSTYDGLKVSASMSFGLVDNFVYEFGEADPEPEPEPTPVPAPGAIVLAGIGTCVASWIRKRKMA